MKLCYIVFLFAALQLAKGAVDHPDGLYRSSRQNAKFRRDVSDAPEETPAVNEDEPTYDRKLGPEDIETETENTFSDSPTDTDTQVPDVVKSENEQSAGDIPVEEISVYSPDVVQEGEISVSIPDHILVKAPPKYYMRGREVSSTGDETNTPVKEFIQDDVVKLIPDVVARDGGNISPDQVLDMDKPTFYVKRGGQNPGEEIYVPIQDLVKGGVNVSPDGVAEDGNSTPSPATDVVRPKETYYIRQDGANPGEDVYIPIQDVVGENGIYLDKLIIHKSGNPTLEQDKPGPFWAMDNFTIPENGGPVLPIPYYMNYIRRDKGNEPVVLDDAENIPRPVPYGPLYMESPVFKGQEENVTFNDTTEFTDVEKPTIYVEGALRATGGGFEEEPNPGDVRLFVKQNKYPSMVPVMSVPPKYVYPTITDTESVNVDGANAEVYSTATTEDKIESTDEQSKTTVIVPSEQIKSPLKSSIPNQDAAIKYKEVTTATPITTAKPSVQTTPKNVNANAKPPVKTTARLASPNVQTKPNAKSSPTKPAPPENNSPVKTPAKSPPAKQSTTATTTQTKTTPTVKSTPGKPSSTVTPPVKEATPVKATPVNQVTTVKTQVNVNNNVKTTTTTPTTTVEPSTKTNVPAKSVPTVKSPAKANNPVKTPPTTKAAAVKSPVKDNVPAKPAPTVKAPAVKSPAKDNVPAKSAPTAKAPAVKSPAKDNVPAKSAPTVKAPAVKSPAKDNVPAKSVPTVKAPAVKSPAKDVPAKSAPTVKAAAVKSPVKPVPTTKAPPVKSPVTKTPPVNTAPTTKAPVVQVAIDTTGSI